VTRGLPRRPPPLGPAGAIRPFPRARSATLGNGLRLLQLPSPHDLPLVRLQLLIASGTFDDPAGRPGVAYLTAAMVDEGAGQRSALRISADLQQLGTSLVTVVDGDSTRLSVELLAGHLEPALAILADVVRRPHLEPTELQRVTGEVHGRALARRGRPGSVASLCLDAAVFGRHPYGRPVLPRPAEIAAINTADLKRFHRRHYRPNNATVIAAGAVDAARLELLVRRAFGGWRAGPPLRRLRPPAPPRIGAGPRLLLVARPGAQESVLRVGHLAPPRRSSDQVGLDVLNTVLGGSFTSRLNQNLRERNGFTYGVGSSFAPLKRLGLFAVRTSVDRDATLPALREIAAELRLIRARGVRRSELDKAARLVLEELPVLSETVRGLTGAYAGLVACGVSLQDLQRLPARVAALTAGELHALARRHLDPAAAVVVVVGDVDNLDLEPEYGPAVRLDLDGDPLEG
jgi:zinc protease